MPQVTKEGKHSAASGTPQPTCNGRSPAAQCPGETNHMSEPYPDYPRDENGLIPEPRCWDVLTVMAEYGPVYLWDMNSFAISLESVTGHAEELDAKLTKWATRYDDEFPQAPTVRRPTGREGPLRRRGSGARPPLPDQRRIVAELDALQAQVDALQRLQSETATELDALLPSILDKAFKGEL